MLHYAIVDAVQECLRNVFAGGRADVGNSDASHPCPAIHITAVADAAAAQRTAGAIPAA